MTNLTIKNHRLVEAMQMPSPNRSGEIDPKFIVLHYTAGWSAEGSVAWLQKKEAKASAHLIIGRSGSVTQMVPFNIKAWHAGPSEFNGVHNLNGHSIGIELDNPGWVKKGTLKLLHNGRPVKDTAKFWDEYSLVKEDHPRISGKDNIYWAAYTIEQLNVLDDVIDALREEYDIQDIASHEEIDKRGWKTDPGPAFPMEHYKKKFQSREDEEVVQFSWLTGEGHCFPNGGVIKPIPPYRYGERSL